MRPKPYLSAVGVMLLCGLVVGVAGCDEDKTNGNTNNNVNQNQNTNTNGNQNTNTNQNTNNDPVGAITAEDQTILDATQVNVAAATSVGPGWVVIHADEMGAPGEVLGQTAVSDGDSNNISVTLSRDATDGETLWAMLHQDLGTVGTFEPSLDVAALDASDNVIQDSFVVTVSMSTINALNAGDQTLTDLSTVVQVASASSDTAGWIVIHEDNMGSPGPVVGVAAVTSGSSQNVAVALDRPAGDAEAFIAMLHQDLGIAGTWEPSEDLPAEDGSGVVTSDFTVTVPASTPAVRVYVTSIGSSSYDFTGVEPAAFAGLIGMETEDQTLTLLSGWRYEVVNSAAGSHPFELLTQGANPNQDTVLLSQSAAGTLEGDTDIAWTDDTNQTIQFTISPTLQAALDGYRCSIHTSTMRGNITITP